MKVTTFLRLRQDYLGIYYESCVQGLIGGVQGFIGLPSCRALDLVHLCCINLP